MAVKVIKKDDFVKIPYIKGKFARGLVWPGMGSKFTTVNYFEMEPGDENVPHVHWNSEDNFYILSGEGYVVDLDSGEEHHIYPGCQVFVEPGTWHTVRIVGDSTYSSIGGPCPPDPEMFEKAGVMDQVGFGVYYAAYHMIKNACAVKDTYDYKPAVPSKNAVEAVQEFVALAECQDITPLIVSGEKAAQLTKETGWTAPSYMVLYGAKGAKAKDDYSLGRLLAFLEIGAKSLRLVPRIEVTSPPAKAKLAATLQLPAESEVLAVVGLGYVDYDPPEEKRK